MRFRIPAICSLLLLAPLVAYAGIVVKGALTHEHDIEPGHSYEGTIEVLNQGDAPEEVKVYQTDYFFFSDGSVLYGDPGGLTRSNARWMTFAPKLVRIPPGETVAIHYTLQSPDDPTMKGTYWSVLMVEPVPEGSPESSGADSKQPTLGIRQVLRYAVQIVTHVGATGTRQLRFSQVRLTAEGGNRLLVVDLENTGERWLRAIMWADLYDSGGNYVGKFEGGRQRLYPGTSARFTAGLLVGVPDASYKALIVVDCGGDDVFGASVTLSLKG